MKGGIYYIAKYNLHQKINGKPIKPTFLLIALLIAACENENGSEYEDQLL